MHQQYNPPDITQLKNRIKYKDTIMTLLKAEEFYSKMSGIWIGDLCFYFFSNISNIVFTVDS